MERSAAASSAEPENTAAAHASHPVAMQREHASDFVDDAYPSSRLSATKAQRPPQIQRAGSMPVGGGKGFATLVFIVLAGFVAFGAIGLLFSGQPFKALSVVVGYVVLAHAFLGEKAE